MKYRVAGWLGLLIFTPPLFIPWTENSAVAIGVFSVFVLLSICFLVEGNNSLEMTSEMIIEQKLYGRYGMRWDDIETILFFVSGDWVPIESMVIEGNKRLVIPGPRDWGGQGGAELRQWFYIEVRRRGLAIKESSTAAFKFSKNVRLP